MRLDGALESRHIHHVKIIPLVDAMASSGEMVTGVAALFGANPVTVDSIDRSLSEAGLRRKGGRGRSAAKMSGIDITNLTFAMMLGVGMKEAPAAVSKVSALPKTRAVVQWRPKHAAEASPFELQVGQYEELTADTQDLAPFPMGVDLVASSSLGEGIAALIDGIAVGALDGVVQMSLNMQMNSVGPSALINFSVPAGTLRVEYAAQGEDAERPVFERRLKLDESLLHLLANIIRT